MKKVSTFFSVVSKEMHAARSIVSNLIDDERAAARREAKAKADKAKSDRILEANARYNEIRKRKREEAKAAGLLVDPVLDAIDNIFLDVAEPEVADKKVRVQFSRPKNWAVIAEFYGQWEKSKTLMVFQEEFEGRSDRSADQALRQWLVDFRSQKLIIASNRAPAYGTAIDNLLLAETKTRIAAGLPTDYTTLRLILVGLLESHRKSDLLEENGGKNSFQHGWAYRFWKRHNLVSRAVTTKMRLLPGNFAALEENYITVAAQMIRDHNIPPDLVYGQDETNAQFVSRPNRTQTERGSKRVRLLGVGCEKPQITVTFTVKETGEVVGLLQLIFGGKTKKCEPQKPPRANTYYNHTKSHWQTPATYITYLAKVIVPNKNATIERLKLPLDQKAIVVHDLHYSHKDAAVLDFMKENNLISLYIPAACTDVMQTCDTVANKPFKVGFKAAFRDYLHTEYGKWMIANPEEEVRGQWNPKITMGALKEQITGFVSIGMDTLKTPEIAEAFGRDSRFTITRSAERQALVAHNQDANMIDEGEEPEVPGENIAVDADRAFAVYADSESDNSDFEDFDFDQICDNVVIASDFVKLK